MICYDFRAGFDEFLFGIGEGVGEVAVDIEFRKGREERFLSSQADPFTGVNGEEKIGLLRSK